jgi:hypothetical protein
VRGGSSSMSMYVCVSVCVDQWDADMCHVEMLIVCEYMPSTLLRISTHMGE